MSLSDFVFNSDFKKDIEDTIDLVEYSPRLSEKGFAPVWAILFCGPPGCGKTTLAREIAELMDFKVCEKETSEIVDSHMGEAGRKFSDAFQDNHGRCLILNEFDALGMSREGSSDSGAGREQIRTTSAILQCMDREKNKPALFVATTNHLENIDKAVLRRFSKIIHFKEPTAEMHWALVDKLRKKHEFQDDIPEKVFRECSSLAETKRAVEIFMIRQIIEEEKAKKKRAKKKSSEVFRELQESLFEEEGRA